MSPFFIFIFLLFLVFFFSWYFIVTLRSNTQCHHAFCTIDKMTTQGGARDAKMRPPSTRYDYFYASDDETIHSPER